MKYYFWNIWFVPDTWRGEHINIGIMAGSEDDPDDWVIRLSDSVPAARLLDDMNVLGAVLENAENLVDELRDHYSLTLEGVNRMRSQKRNLLQLSSEGVSVAENATELIDDLWPRMIREFVPERKEI
jgi:hypothetical protein